MRYKIQSLFFIFLAHILQTGRKSQGPFQGGDAFRNVDKAFYNKLFIATYICSVYSCWLLSYFTIDQAMVVGSITK